jgi:MFS family permease
LSALRSGAFRWLLASSVAVYLGTGAQLTAIAWLALGSPGGAFTVGLALAARMLPNLLFGLPAGTLADHANRQRLLAVTRLVSLGPPLGLAWLASAPTDTNTVLKLVLLSFATGATSVFDTPTRQAMVMDTTPRDVAPNAMALNATMSRLATALGALVAGILIPTLGVPSCFLLATALFLVAIALGLPIGPTQRHTQFSTTRPRPSFGQALSEAARMIFRLPEVRTLTIAAVACEIFGFSYQTAVPVFARDVLGAGAEGLGTLNAATSFGGAAAVVVLSVVPGRIPRQPVLGGIFLVYGASMLLVAPSNSLSLAAAALLVTGACAASFDVLQQTLLQLAVPEEQRGRAVGLWVLGIGSAPVGNVEMGTLVAVIGAPAALAINGTLVLGAAALLILVAPAFRPWALPLVAGLRQPEQRHQADAS